MSKANSTAEVLTRGMECLIDNMSVVDAERFIFLIKEENFDYTKWQEQYFSGKSRREVEDDMHEYFKNHPERSGNAKVI